MAIEYGYAYVKNGKIAGKVVHTMLSCRTIRTEGPDMAVVTVTDGTAMWRHHRAAATWCRSCPPVKDWNWQEHGACYGLWPAVDMIDMGRGHAADEKIERFCNHCPVVAQCAAFALVDVYETAGIWGGVFVPANVGGKNQKLRLRSIQALRDVCGIVEVVEPPAA